MTVALFETLLVFQPFALFVIRFRNMRPPAHTHPLSGNPPAKHISSFYFTKLDWTRRSWLFDERKLKCDKKIRKSTKEELVEYIQNS